MIILIRQRQSENNTAGAFYGAADSLGALKRTVSAAGNNSGGYGSQSGKLDFHGPYSREFFKQRFCKVWLNGLK